MPLNVNRYGFSVQCNVNSKEAAPFETQMISALECISIMTALK